MAERLIEKPGIWQPIVGYHRDEDGDWVAELGCLHYQHVRHDPPWRNREWVLSAGSRRSRLGRLLNCVKCFAGAEPDNDNTNTSTGARIPSNLTPCGRTPVFKPGAVPSELTKEHATACGVWSLLRVHSGSLKFCLATKGYEAIYEITPDAPRVIPEKQPHYIVVDDDVSFQFEFFRSSNSRHANTPGSEP